MRERERRGRNQSSFFSSSSFFLSIITIVGTKPTRFPARRCLRDHARISAAMVMISGAEEEVEVDMFFAFCFSSIGGTVGLEFIFSPSSSYFRPRLALSLLSLFLRQRRAIKMDFYGSSSDDDEGVSS